MIDFRYHIVSLISVFLALAVGIVLGAGPLRDYIADSLSGQVEVLRGETEDLREQLDINSDALDNANNFIVSAADALTEGTLPAYTVSLVALPGVDSQTINELGDTLTTAGASVLNIVEISEEFTDPAKRPFRSGIASNVTTYMDPEAPEDASAEAVLGQALDQALGEYDPADPQDPSEDAQAIMELLRSSELVSVDGDVLPTLLTVVITSDSAASEEELAAGLGLIKGTSPSRTVVAGTDAEDTLLRVVRTDSAASDTYTSTDSLTTIAGKIIVPRALALIVDGDGGSFGFGQGADSPLPPDTDLSAPEPIEPATDDEDSDADDSQDEAGDAGPDPDAGAPYQGVVLSGGIM